MCSTKTTSNVQPESESYFQQKRTRSPAIAGTASIESQHHRVSLGMREDLEVVQTAQSHRRIMESFPRCLEKPVSVKLGKT